MQRTEHIWGTAACTDADDDVVATRGQPHHVELAGGRVVLGGLLLGARSSAAGDDCRHASRRDG
jgi:hypothetical protein